MAITNTRIVAVLRKVPEKKFQITELAPRLLDAKGKVDIAKCLDRQSEINLAIAEVSSYIKSTRSAVDELKYLGTSLRQPEDGELEPFDFEDLEGQE